MATSGEHATKRLRYIARILALIWASWWTFFGLASGLYEGLSLAGVLLYTARPGLVFLISVALAWRWKSIGGIVLVLEGVLVLIIYPIMYNHFPITTIIFVLVTMALPPLIAGFLFIAIDRKSTIYGRPQYGA